MKNGVTIFREEAISISNTFPGLSLIEMDGKPVVAGELALTDNEGVVYTTYVIEIHPVEDYPNSFPVVFEKGGRIPCNIDWHIFETDGHCCLKSLAEELLACKAGINLIGFITNEVIPYFFNQLHRERYGYFLTERSHGLPGELEFFFDVFRTTDLLKIYELMLFVSKRKEPSRTEECFCGSREKYRRCHRDAYRTAIKFTDTELKYFIRRLTTSTPFILSNPQLSMGLSKMV